MISIACDIMQQEKGNSESFFSPIFVSCFKYSAGENKQPIRTGYENIYNFFNQAYLSNMNLVVFICSLIRSMYTSESDLGIYYP